MKRKKPRNATVQVTDGAWYAIGHGYTHEDCCCCGFSHRVDYKLENGRIFVRYRIDQRRSQRNQRRENIIVVRGR